MRRPFFSLMVLIAVALPARAQCVDLDGDGFGSPASTECTFPNLDCNDASALVFPGAEEFCNAVDDDCDGSIDDAERCPRGCPLPDSLGVPRPVTTDDIDSEAPALAWNGASFGVAWRGHCRPCDISFRRLDALGTPDSSPRRVSEDPANSNSPTLAWTGAEYGLCWADDRAGAGQIYFSRLSTTGEKLQQETPVSSSPTGAGFPALVWTGRDFAAVWVDTRDGRYAIYFARFTASGDRITSDTRVSNSPGDCWQPTLVWTGEEFGVAWYDGRHGNGEIYFGRMSANGLRIGEDVRITSAPGTSDEPSLAWHGSGYGIAWHDGRDGDYRVYFAPLGREGQKLAEDLRVSTSESSQYSPSLTWTGSEYGIVWEDGRQGAGGIYFTRISANAVPLAPEVNVSRSDSLFTETAVAWTGADYGVAWYEAISGFWQVHFARVGCHCEADSDGDGYTDCSDCNDSDDAIHPRAPEKCNALDDDCDGQIDEDPAGADTDADGIGDACDNCLSRYNSDQLNADHDAFGNACDNCQLVPNDNQADLDDDGRGDLCDNCAGSYNPAQDDADGDQVGDVCDNCLVTRNESQHDEDDDAQGDECDLDDAVVLFRTIGRPRVRWQSDPSYSTYNLYRGSLAALRATGVYTQEPGSNPYAGRYCGLSVTYQDDSLVPLTGEAFYWLVSGVGVAGEEPLGDGAGVHRPNTSPCP